MSSKNIPMVPNRKSLLPHVYGDTPSFLGVPVLRNKKEIKGKDAVVMGVPWEGTITWGSYSGCELAPKAIRHASARYGGYLPEYEVDLFDYLRLGDIGDISVDPCNPEETMENVESKAKEIFSNGAIPLSLGGDHSFSPAIVKALSKNISGEIGIIHFDGHLDNVGEFGQDRFPRCGPLYHIANIPKVKNSSIVHFGIRGPRNAPSQVEFAKKIGAKIFTILEIRKLGIKKAVESAMDIAYKGTKSVYVTICSDSIEAAYNPGGPADFDGLTPHELFYALNCIGRRGIKGLDFVEVYPLSDLNNFSAHLATWSIIHALVGVAMRKKGE
jgi:guanidinopropionase